MDDRSMASQGWSQPQQVFDAKGWAVLDPVGEKIGKLDDVFVGSDNQPRYIGVKIGLFGTKMTLIPVQLVIGIDPDEEAVRVSITKDVAKEGPMFDRDHQFTPEDEAMIWDSYGLGEPTYVVTEVYVWPLAS
jgi:PRC-barrel domain